MKTKPYVLLIVVLMMAACQPKIETKTVDVAAVENVSAQIKQDKEDSAGEGKGSIIIYNGRPMRITLYNSQYKGAGGGAWGSDMLGTGTAQRTEIIKGKYLDGDGEEVKIGGDGWHDV